MKYTITTEDGLIRAMDENKKMVEIKSIFLSLEEDRNYSMEIKLMRAIRTANQNRYYWACIGMIADECGYIHPDMENSMKSEVCDGLHEILKDRFLSGKTIRSYKDKRKRIKLPTSTKILDTKEFKEYMDKIKFLHPYLPDPDTIDSDNLLAFIDQYYWR